MADYLRKMDDLGRIALPKELRKQLGFWGGDTFQVSVLNDNTVTIKKYDPEYVRRLQDLRAEFEDRPGETAEILETLDRAINLIQNYKED